MNSGDNLLAYPISQAHIPWEKTTHKSSKRIYTIYIRILLEWLITSANYLVKSNRTYFILTRTTKSNLVCSNSNWNWICYHQSLSFFLSPFILFYIFFIFETVHHQQSYQHLKDNLPTITDSIDRMSYPQDFRSNVSIDHQVIMPTSKPHLTLH